MHDGVYYNAATAVGLSSKDFFPVDIRGFSPLATQITNEARVRKKEIRIYR